MTRRECKRYAAQLVAEVILQYLRDREQPNLQDPNDQAKVDASLVELIHEMQDRAEEGTP